jgi:peptidoglycan/xylan/chitin deacetylase (PgdA/CDA1 family)
MKQKIIKIAIKFGGLQLAKFLTQRTPRIFMYHSFSQAPKAGYVSAEQFEWQLRQIKKGFNPITLLELSKLVSSNYPIPKNTVVLTIDDGYKNFYDIAYPLLKKYDIPATFFVTTGFINRDLWLWPDKLKWILNENKTKLSKVTLNNQEFTLLGTFQQNWQAINDYCLSVTDDIKHVFIKSLANQLNISLPLLAPQQFEPCSWDMLQEMQSWGVEIGGHTVTHPSLGQVSIVQAAEEIEGCLKEINSKLGEKERTFCYPNGSPSDYDEIIKGLAKTSGYKAAVTAFNDRLNLEIPFSWRRYDGGNNKLGFLKSLFGVEYLGCRLRKHEKSPY